MCGVIEWECLRVCECDWAKPSASGRSLLHALALDQLEPSGTGFAGLALVLATTVGALGIRALGAGAIGAPGRIPSHANRARLARALDRVAASAALGVGALVAGALGRYVARAAGQRAGDWRAGDGRAAGSWRVLSLNGGGSIGGASALRLCGRLRARAGGLAGKGPCLRFTCTLRSYCRTWCSRVQSSWCTTDSHTHSVGYQSQEW